MTSNARSVLQKDAASTWWSQHSKQQEPGTASHAATSIELSHIDFPPLLGSEDAQDAFQEMVRSTSQKILGAHLRRCSSASCTAG